MRVVLCVVAGLLVWSTAGAEISIKHEGPAPFRMYSGDELVQEYATREDALLAVIEAARQCTPEPNYVYTEIVSAVNSECGKDAPAEHSEKKSAPAVTTPTTPGTAEQNETQPPDTSQAPAGEPGRSPDSVLLFPLPSESALPTLRER